MLPALLPPPPPPPSHYLIMENDLSNIASVLQEGDSAVVKNKSKEETIDPADPTAIITKASVAMDDEYSQRKGSMNTYYSIAHTFREPVTKQPELLVNGTLKEYQVRV